MWKTFILASLAQAGINLCALEKPWWFQLSRAAITSADEASKFKTSLMKICMNEEVKEKQWVQRLWRPKEENGWWPISQKPWKSLQLVSSRFRTLSSWNLHQIELTWLVLLCRKAGMRKAVLNSVSDTLHRLMVYKVAFWFVLLCCASVVTLYK